LLTSLAATVSSSAETANRRVVRTVRIGRGERGACRRFDAHVNELAFAALQYTFDLAQQVCTAQLAEQPGDERPPDREPPRCDAPVCRTRRSKLMRGRQLDCLQSMLDDALTTSFLR
jgi:hypothetical protein